MLSICDYFVLISGESERQLKAITEGIEQDLRADDVRPLRREGERDRRWLLLDFVDVVVHVFDTETRAYYEIERLWKDAPVIAWEDEATRPDRARGGAQR